MVGTFQKVASSMQVILIGNFESRNNQPLALCAASWYAMTRDVRQRVRFDPSAQFAGGLSGGAWAAYEFARDFAPHIQGVISMGGWLGKQYDRDTDWHAEGLLVARSTGADDSGAKTWLKRDEDYLSKFRAKVEDWEFPGGHVSAPPDIQRKIFAWLLEERQHPPDGDRERAKQLQAKAQETTTVHAKEALFIDCIEILQDNPWTQQALEAQNVIDQIMASDDKHCTRFRLRGLRKATEVTNLFVNQMRGAGMAGDGTTFRSAIHCLKTLGVDEDNWLSEALWFAATVKHGDVRDAATSTGLLDELGHPSTNLERAAAAAAHALLGENEAAKRVFGRIDLDDEDDTSSLLRVRYDELQGIIHAM